MCRRTPGASWSDSRLNGAQLEPPLKEASNLSAVSDAKEQRWQSKQCVRVGSPRLRCEDRGTQLLQADSEQLTLDRQWYGLVQLAPMPEVIAYLIMG